MTAKMPINFITLNLNLNNAITAANVSPHANQSKLIKTWLNDKSPFGQKICTAKNKAKLTMTPTTAAVMAINGAVSFTLSCVDSINGAPKNIKTNEGKNVKKVTTHAAKIAENNALSAQKKRLW